MDKVVLDDIPFRPDYDSLVKRLRIRKESSAVDDLRTLVVDALAVARPKAMYKVGFIESRSDDSVVIDGIAFTSRILRVNLEQAHRVLAYVATCGTELQDWADSLDDLLMRYWADTIQHMALGSAIEALNTHMTEHYHLGQTSTMSPGRLGDWPLSQQRPLFAMLGNAREAIGVQLSEGLLMIPTKSVSGIRFPTEESFESCQLCPRPDCPGRKAPYDKGLYDRRYRQKVSSL